MMSPRLITSPTTPWSWTRVGDNEPTTMPCEASLLLIDFREEDENDENPVLTFSYGEELFWVRPGARNDLRQFQGLDDYLPELEFKPLELDYLYKIDYSTPTYATPPLEHIELKWEFGPPKIEEIETETVFKPVFLKSLDEDA